MTETTSLELSKRLRDAGAKQESKEVWDNCFDLTVRVHTRTKRKPRKSGWAAFILAEMWPRITANGHRLLVDTQAMGDTSASLYDRKFNKLWEVGSYLCVTETVGLLYEWALKEGKVTE